MSNFRQDKYIDTVRPRCSCGKPADAIGNNREILCAGCWLDRYAGLDKIKLDRCNSLIYDKLDNVGVLNNEKSRYK